MKKLGKMFLMLCLTVLLGVCALPGQAQAKTGGLGSTSLKVFCEKQNKITLKWNAVRGAKGYQICRAEKKNGAYKKIAAVKGSKLTYTDKVDSGSKCFYKVRAYKGNGGSRTYGAYSAAKKGKEIGAVWYEKVLASKKGSYKVRVQYDQAERKETVFRSQFTYYKVFDLNGDGVKELLLAKPFSEEDIENRVLLLTYHKNKVKPLICFEMNGARGKVFLQDDVLILCNSGSDFSYRMDVSVKNGKLKKLRDFTYQKVADVEHEQTVMYYYFSGEKVSEERFTELQNEYPVTAKEMKYKKIN